MALCTAVSRVARLRPASGRVSDAALAGGVFVLVALGSAGPLFGRRDEPWPLTALGWALIAVTCAALYARRRHPVAVALVTLGATAAYYLTSVYDGPLMVAVVVALYAVAAGGLLVPAVVIAALLVLGVGAGTLAGNNDVNGVAVLMLTGWVIAVIALGWVRHSRLAWVREAERRAATEERLRIARELHDVVGHHVSLVNVQASAALHRFGKDQAQAEPALAAIKESSREALRELRATLGVLRRTGEEAPTAPTPGLDRIAELVEQTRRAGLPVVLRTGDGDDGPPPPAEVGLAAYRIVQESLTNAVRHADATTLTVRVERGPRHVALEITDDGRGPATARGGAPGSGISSMRERVRALGGEFTAGPGPDGGFAVRARLPYGERGSP